MVKKIVKYVGITAAAAIGIYAIAIAVVGAQLSSVFEETYTKNDLVNNFKTRQQQILSLRDYFNSIVPKNKAAAVPILRIVPPSSWNTAEAPSALNAFQSNKCFARLSEETRSR